MSWNLPDGCTDADVDRAIECESDLEERAEQERDEEYEREAEAKLMEHLESLDTDDDDEQDLAPLLLEGTLDRRAHDFDLLIGECE